MINPPVVAIIPVEDTVTPGAVVMTDVVKALLALTFKVPDMSPNCVVVVKKLRVKVADVLPNVNIDPLAMTKLFVEAGPLRLRVWLATVDCRVIVVLLVTNSFPIVCVGTAVTVYAAASLNCITSFAAGVVRVGFQFVLNAQLPPEAPIHV